MLTSEGLSKHMQDVCANNGVSQTELAELAGLTKSHVSLLWNCKISNITSKTYFRITEALKKIEGRHA